MNTVFYILLFLLLFTNSCKENSSAASFNQKKEITKAMLSDSLKPIADIHSLLNETSGLIYYKNKLFTHNDKGNPNHVFVIDTATATVKNLIILSNASNIDYEDMAQSPDYIFIGDIGNKFGDRKDLCIYKIKKTDLDFSSDTIKVTTTKITFTYSNQKDFMKNKDHNFDCEAMVYFNDNLYLFTKNRLDKKCNLYMVSDKEGRNEAEYIGTFNTDGLITGADISSDGTRLVLTGYNKKGNTFLWLYSDFKNNNFFSGKAEQIILGPFNKVGQAEAVCFSNSNKLFITVEKSDDMPARLYSLQL